MSDPVYVIKYDHETLCVQLVLSVPVTYRDEGGLYPVDALVDDLLDAISERLTLNTDDYQMLITKLTEAMDAPLPQETGRR